MRGACFYRIQTSLPCGRGTISQGSIAHFPHSCWSVKVCPNVEFDVQQVLGRYPSRARSQAVTPLGMAGGLSGANFWKVSSPSGVLVLRRWPKDHPPPDRLQWIHGVLRQVSRHGVTYVPVPLETLERETVVVHRGHLWELSPWMPGVADFYQRPSTARLTAAMSALIRSGEVIV